MNLWSCPRLPHEMRNGQHEPIDPRHLSGIREKLVKWYDEHHRPLPWRKTNDPYAIWVSEVMLQQTQVNTVIPYYHRFLERFPNLHTLADSDLQDVLKVWEGLGYYARARNLHRAARIVVAEHRGHIPSDPRAFRHLPGVGEYIAAAVLSIAFDQPHAVVDGNVKRVLARMFKIETPVNAPRATKVFRENAKALLDTRQPGTFNQALMELGATVCTLANPACGVCPVQSFCAAHTDGITNEYPKSEPRKPVPEYRIAVGVVHRNGQMLITQRRPKGLLGGLWEFPGGKLKDGESAEQACLREISEEVGLTVDIARYLTRIRHAYTHLRVVLDVFECTHVSGEVKLNGPVDFRWVTLDELEAYPFPKANTKFIPLLKQGS